MMIASKLGMIGSPAVLKIGRNVALRRTPADQQIAIGQQVDWVRPIDDGEPAKSSDSQV